MQQWIWQGIGVELPDDWEMLQFSRRQGDGRCAFADRQEYRFELRWRIIQGQPDLERMFSDHVARLKSEGAMSDARIIKVADCRGITGRVGPVTVTRFIRYFADPSCLVEPVFYWSDRTENALQRRALSSLSMEPSWRGDRYARWRAFGMDLLAASTYAFTACSVEPAAVRMTFARYADGSAPSNQFQRLGMLAHWLRGTVEQWLLVQRPKNLKKVNVKSTTTRSIAGHEVTTVVGTCAARSMEGFFRRVRPYQAAAWTCPEDGRLYNVSCGGGPKSEDGGLDLAGGRLVCCEALRQAVGARE